MGQADSCNGQQAPICSVAKGRTTRRGTDTRLLAESAAPVQEARKQKLSKHLSAISNIAFKQHSVSTSFLFVLADMKLGVEAERKTVLIDTCCVRSDCCDVVILDNDKMRKNRL